MSVGETVREEEKVPKVPSKLPKVAFWLLTLSLVVVFLAWLYLPNSPSGTWFSKNITSYEVESQLNEVRPAEIQNVLDDYKGRSFWDVPIDEIQGRLTQLDWVLKAEVIKVWPDILKVNIYEQQPVARWGEDGLINHQGQVFFPYSLDGYKDLIMLNGNLASSKRVLQRWVEVSDLFAQQQLSLIGLVLKPGEIWQIKLADGKSVILEEKNWQQKLRQFFLAYQQLSEELLEQAQTFDLRYSNGFVVGKKTP